MKIRINSDVKLQSFNGFGASGAWWAQEVGGWSEADEKSGISKRDRISQLLYSKKDGIGLNIYRYNIGGGSVESGRGSFSEPLRRTECFYDEKGNYDWSKDKNAVYMMKKAAGDGADEIILFVNSPVEKFTKNHLAHTDKNKPFTENLPKKNYEAFAKYCADVTEHFVKEKLPIKYLSPVNEPLWIWNGGQEGCHYRPKSVKKVMKATLLEMKKRKALDEVRLSGAENGDIRWFNKSYTRQLLRDSEVRNHLDGVDVHSYCLPVPQFLPFKSLLNNRVVFVKRFRKWMDKNYPGVSINMSEWTDMVGGRDKTMTSALRMANVIHEDIAFLGASSWSHWIAVSEVDYCDGLIYINLPERTFEMTKRYYVTGNFSKYLTLGATRTECLCDDEEVKALAFLSDGKTTLIIINDSEKEKELSLEIPKEALVTVAVTNETKDLDEQTYIGLENLKITKKSVTTIVY